MRCGYGVVRLRLYLRGLGVGEMKRKFRKAREREMVYFDKRGKYDLPSPLLGDRWSIWEGHGRHIKDMGPNAAGVQCSRLNEYGMRSEKEDCHRHAWFSIELW